MSQPEQLPPQIIDSTEIFGGRVFSVTVDTVREGETTYKREVVHHPGQRGDHSGASQWHCGSRAPISTPGSFVIFSRPQREL